MVSHTKDVAKRYIVPDDTYEFDSQGLLQFVHFGQSCRHTALICTVLKQSFPLLQLLDIIIREAFAIAVTKAAYQLYRRVRITH
jgi:hypothetical protein